MAGGDETAAPTLSVLHPTLWQLSSRLDLNLTRHQLTGLLAPRPRVGEDLSCLVIVRWVGILIQDSCTLSPDIVLSVFWCVQSLIPALQSCREINPPPVHSRRENKTK